MNDEDRQSSEQPSEQLIPARRSMSQATRDYLELMRLPNVFTAMADVVMGFFFVQTVETQADAWALALLIAASSLLYIGGVVFNDIFDIDIDRVERPQRPLPSARVSVRAASRLGWKALLLGVLAGAGAGYCMGHFRPFVVAALLAVCILLYDARLKRTPLGPLGMGACRMFNVLLGMNIVDMPLQPAGWLVAGGIGVYIGGVTWFARTENDRSDRRPLILATLVIMLGVAMLGWLPHASQNILSLLRQQPQRWYLLIGLLALPIVWRCAWTLLDPTSARVRMAVTQCIFSVVILDAAVCYAVRDVFCAVAILSLLAPAMLLGWWIEST
jgi:4-hydroxybenzoate polyprenyltransferase